MDLIPDTGIQRPKKKSLVRATILILINCWWARWDLNPHELFTQQILSLHCLPIPALARNNMEVRTGNAPVS